MSNHFNWRIPGNRLSPFCVVGRSCENRNCSLADLLVDSLSSPEATRATTLSSASLADEGVLVDVISLALEATSAWWS